jgi:mono/diheme cytochrome c family protein
MSAVSASLRPGTSVALFTAGNGVLPDFRQWEGVMRRIGWLAAIVAVGTASVIVAAQGTTTYTSGNDFQSFCASCHGSAGKGDGVLAGSLRKRPADLTQLTVKNDGVYPAEAVMKIIDGGHESADMPAWKDVFAKSQESAGADAAKVRMDGLAKYIETLQKKP